MKRDLLSSTKGKVIGVWSLFFFSKQEHFIKGIPFLLLRWVDHSYWELKRVFTWSDIATDKIITKRYIGDLPHLVGARKVNYDKVQKVSILLVLLPFYSGVFLVVLFSVMCFIVAFSSEKERLCLTFSTVDWLPDRLGLLSKELYSIM